MSDRRPPEAPPRPAAGNAAWPAARETAHLAGRQLIDTADEPVRQPVGLEDALGHVLSADVHATNEIPHFAASAMDGWAVAGDGPWQVLDGDARTTTSLSPGEGVVIVTGSPLPGGATAVLRRERGRLADAPRGGGTGEARRLLHATEPVGHLADIRPAGREAHAGERLFSAGTFLTPGHLAAAAVAGLDELPTLRVPRVGLVLTGDEVVTAGLPGHGLVRDAFGPVLPAAVRGLGGTVVDSTRIGDDHAATVRALGAGGVDVVIATGGTGHSGADHIRPALAELGAELLVDQIAMRPGHPALLARRCDGALVIALPGNPLAAMAALVTLGGPVLAGATARSLPVLRRARSTERFDPLPGRYRLVPARLDGDESGVRASAATHRGPAMLRGLADSSCFLAVPPEGLSPGDGVDCVPLPWT
ncbi:molybdopterin molybdotransferase MoeA [Zhihengliuella salsuginis]|uniref:Molybdopterin molybdenumtransferase n=1 Tax=Zhihengliuella salsuginis TaxID=578222 RepID=A0ABQ3GLT6_9MICC|nr:molybdopterin molybdotransferase MoeA [Zhihengliuella salsuginis]GHD10521.1 molybdopterin molybdenumtransferase MoeA [Zhihengliuella salsuginis]